MAYPVFLSRLHAASAAGPGRWCDAVASPLAVLLISLAAGLGTGFGPGSRASAQPPDARLQRWGDGQRLELLLLQQSNADPGARDDLELLIRPQDLSRPTATLELLPSPRLNGRLLAQRLRLCRLESAVARRRSRCLEELPLRLEWRGSSLLLRPERPLQPGTAYGLLLQFRNPFVEGRHPLRLFGRAPEQAEPTYIGTWLIEVLSQSR